MALKGEAGIHLAHTSAVVNHLHQRAPGVFYHDAHGGCARVYGVFHQLFYHRGRALNNLAGRYLVGYAIG